MKKVLFLLGIFLLVFSNSKGSAQVFGYPGARWVFYSPEMWSMCSELCETWDYTGDTVIMGVPAKKVEVMRKNGWIVFPDSFQISYFNRFFHVSGDSVSAFIPNDSTWQLMYDFSLQIGDTTHSPLKNIYASIFACQDQWEDLPAVVIDAGLDTIAGQTLKFYTLHYIVFISGSNDTTYANQTYYERVITYDYWYPVGPQFCGAVTECGPPSLVCYKDNAMLTDSACIDISWIDHLSVSEETSTSYLVYPNPASDILIIQTNTSFPAFYDILSIDGKLIFSREQSPINISTLTSGIYFLTDPGRTWVKKFIKN
jgi:hypothetical protein